jgi:hypothetical protein
MQGRDDFLIGKALHAALSTTKDTKHTNLNHEWHESQELNFFGFVSFVKFVVVRLFAPDLFVIVLFVIFLPPIFLSSFLVFASWRLFVRSYHLSLAMTANRRAASGWEGPM